MYSVVAVDNLFLFSCNHKQNKKGCRVKHRGRENKEKYKMKTITTSLKVSGHIYVCFGYQV